ncbi:MAG: hypothetical protein GY952_08935 [Rhodobacteraceae bacterium]|nr:hypothetical protein [Paracoccaceae bacterium]
MPGHPERSADDYLAQYRDGAKAAGVRILALVALILATWIVVVEKTQTQAIEYRISKMKADTLRDQKDAVIKGIQKRVNDEKQNAAANADTQASGNYIVVTTANYKEKANEKEKGEYEGLDSRFQAETVRHNKIREPNAIRILGYEFEVPAYFVGVLLSCMLLVLLSYIRHNKTALSTSLLKATLAFEKLSGGAVKPTDIAGPAPFWLAPVHLSSDPELGSKTEQRTKLLAALGWQETKHKQNQTIVFSSLLLCFLLALRVCFVQFSLTDVDTELQLFAGLDEREPVRLARADWFEKALRVITVLLLGAIAYQAVRLLVDENRHSEQRRRFLVSGSSFSVVSIFGLITFSQLRYWGSSTESQEKVQADRADTLVKPGWYLLVRNGRKTSHYFDPDFIAKRFVIKKKENSYGSGGDRNVKTTPQMSDETITELVSHLPHDRFNFTVELYVMRTIKGELTDPRPSKVPDATNFLRRAVEIMADATFPRRFFSVRLFDLLAKLYALHDPEKLSDLVNLATSTIKSNAPGLSASNKNRLERRIKFWGNQNSYVKWVESEDRAKWKFYRRLPEAEKNWTIDLRAS